MAENETEQSAAPKKSSPLKPIILIIAVLLIEALAIIGTMTLMGGPVEVKGEGIVKDTDAAANKLVEVLVVKGKFDNVSTGRMYIYDTEVFATVRHKNLEQFAADVEGMKTRISAEVQAIFRRAEPSHFQEPTRATLTRQIRAALDKRFGRDEDGESIVQDVVIARCLPYRADF